MKVYLYIAKQKKTLKMYLPYIEALGKSSTSPTIWQMPTSL